MTRSDRIVAESRAAWHTFVRQRTAVFFTFFFPALLVIIFGALVETDAGGGLFARPAAYYVPGYLAVVVLFTPLSRVSSTVARYRDGRRFEKLATTPLGRSEWLLAHTLVNAALVFLAAAIVLLLVVGLTGARFSLSPLLVPYIALGVVVFCGLGALLGRLSDSRDGAIAAANAVGFPLLFLSDTFVPPDLLPPWFEPLMAASPLTYFARGVRAAIGAAPTESVTGAGDPFVALGMLAAIAVAAFTLGAVALPWRS